MEYLALTALPRDLQDLAEAAREAAAFASAPYSRFHVGAALLCADGRIVTGANYESASYGLTICAERTALVRANMEAHGTPLRALAVYATSAGALPADAFTTPCGACRQLIAEAAARSAAASFPVLCLHPRTDQVLLTSINELLPHAFLPG